MKFKKWIPKNEDRYQPRTVRLYFANNSFVGFSRHTRQASSYYERHRVCKGEILFGEERFTFGGFSEGEAFEILDQLKFARANRLGISVAEAGVANSIEFAEEYL